MINDNLFAQMQALYAAWFIDCIPFGGIKPSSWQKTSIYTIADIIYGAPFSSKQFNTDGKGIPIIRIRDLKEQKVATYTTEKHPKGYLLQAGDIVVGMDGEKQAFKRKSLPLFYNQTSFICNRANAGGHNRYSYWKKGF